MTTGRAVRRAAIVVVATVVVANAGLLLAVPVARALGGDNGVVPMDGVDKLRRVDDRLWAGAQPDDAGYRGLAEAGIRLVVDVRTGADDDPREDDPALLRSLGMERVELPMPDGHAPDRRTVRRFIRTVEAADGPVFVHCGAGVGRTTSLQAAWLAHTGDRLAVLDALSIGPLSIDQVWFVSRRRPGRPAGGNAVVQRVSEVVDAPRRAWSRARAVVG